MIVLVMLSQKSLLTAFTGGKDWRINVQIHTARTEVNKTEQVLLESLDK